MIYRVFNIDYCIEPEDLELDREDFETEDEYNLACEKEIAAIIEEEDLPNELWYDVEAEDIEDLEDTLCEMISDETGWLVNSFEYEEIGEGAI